MSLANIPFFHVAEHAGARITLESDERHLVHLFIVEEDIVRVMVLPSGAVSFPRTWAIAPGQEDVPLEGRDRFDVGGFALPPYQLEQNPDKLQITTNRVRLTIQLKGLYCRWEIFQDGAWRFAAADGCSMPPPELPATRRACD